MKPIRYRELSEAYDALLEENRKLRILAGMGVTEPSQIQATDENHGRLLRIAESVTGFTPEMILAQDRRVELVAVRAICVNLWMASAKESVVSVATKFHRDHASCYNLQKKLRDGQYSSLKGFKEAQMLIAGYWQDFLESGVMPAVMHTSKVTIR